MKTRKELNLEYWGRVHEICKGTALEGREWECVKWNGNILTAHPHFSPEYSAYALAVCVVEDRPVFVGNVLYHNNTVIVAMNEYFRGENQVGILKIYYGAWLPSQDITWKKPTKKQTFSIECSGKNMGIVIADIPCPVKPNKDNSWVARSIFMQEYSYEFASISDKDKALQSIKQILDAAEKANKDE